MSEPGILPPAPALEPIRRISPSRYASMLECPLRGVYEASSHPELLPSTPSAVLGSIAHKLIEFAATADASSITHASLESKWDELTRRAEESMASCWLEQGHLPLKCSAWRYSVRRLRAIKHSLKIAAERPLGHSIAGDKARFGTAEQWVESRDGTVGGYIDQQLRTAEGVILRDFKTGEIYEESDDSDDSKLRTQYIIQLKIYAALFEATHGEWPVQLQVVPFRGDPINVEFSEEECVAILADAMEFREQINDFVQTEKPEALAKPAPNVCKYCQFRPACGPYRAARDLADDANNWPKDIWGQIAEYAPDFSNGQISITLETARQAERRAIVSGLTTDSQRYPGLHKVDIGRKISVFNLHTTKVPTHYRSGKSTIVYDESGL